MKTLVMGTTNPAKIAQVRDALAPADIQVEGVADKKLLPQVIEDGATVQENARKKATVYAKALGKTVFSMDNALFLRVLDQKTSRVSTCDVSVEKKQQQMTNSSHMASSSSNHSGARRPATGSMVSALQTPRARYGRPLCEPRASLRASGVTKWWLGIPWSQFKSTQTLTSTSQR